MNEEQFNRKFGQKLAALCDANQLSTDQLSLQTKLDKTDLEQFRSGTACPSIPQILVLADYFKVPPSHFFMREPDQGQIEVVKATDRFSGHPRTEASRSLNYAYESLSYQMSDKLMLPLFIQIPPDHDKVIEPSSHEGEEFLYILSGEIEITIANETHTLTKGDSIYFNSAQKHAIRSTGSKPAKLIACLANLSGIHPGDDHPLARALSYGD